jgi:hypothetical protein
VLVANADDFFYDGSREDLESKLASAIEGATAGSLWGNDPDRARRAVTRFHWPVLGPQLDYALRSVAERGRDYVD